MIISIDASKCWSDGLDQTLLQQPLSIIYCGTIYLCDTRFCIGQFFSNSVSTPPNDCFSIAYFRWHRLSYFLGTVHINILYIYFESVSTTGHSRNRLEIDFSRDPVYILPAPQ